jgi:DNA-binding CsgD family transcriptional regulator
MRALKSEVRAVGGAAARSQSPPAEPNEDQSEINFRNLLEIFAARPGAQRSAPGVLLDISMREFRCVIRKAAPPEESANSSLSPREREIVRMVARGYPNKTIAAVLDISIWTVGTYLRRVFAKLGVASRAAMVAKLMDEDWQA